VSWLVPPFSQIGRALEHLEQARAPGVLVCPNGRGPCSGSHCARGWGLLRPHGAGGSRRGGESGAAPQPQLASPTGACGWSSGPARRATSGCRQSALASRHAPATRQKYDRLAGLFRHRRLSCQCHPGVELAMLCRPWSCLCAAATAGAFCSLQYLFRSVWLSAPAGRASRTPSTCAKQVLPPTTLYVAGCGHGCDQLAYAFEDSAPPGG
jgi:hypothetical protein